MIDYLEAGHYFGLESRKTVLDEGTKELEEAKLTLKYPTLILSDDISLVSLERAFHFIWAFSVLIHMSDAILDDALGSVYRHLLDEGVFYANVNIGERDDKTWQGFPIVWRSLAFYEEACLRHRLVLSDLGPLKDLGHNTNIKAQDEQRMLRIRKA